MHLTKKQKRVQNMLENNSNTFGHITWIWKPILNLRYISKNSRILRPFLFPSYEVLLRPIHIKNFEIFQRVLGGFTGFYAVWILKYKLHRTREKLIGWKKKQSKFDFEKAEHIFMGDFAYSICWCLSIH